VLREDSFERVLRTDPWDNWTTITLIVLSGVLSTLEFQGMGYPELSMYGPVAERPWQLVTSALLHGSWLHLAMNLYWTWQFGRVIEPSIGSVNTAWITLLFAAAAGGAAYAFEGRAIGLSGIGFGHFGFLWALSRFHPRGRALLDERVVSFFVLWFFLCIGMTYWGDYPIANAAHGAGAVVGFLLGWGLAKGSRWFAWQRWLAPLVALGCVAASMAIEQPWMVGAR
jgi:GlpG protein